MIFIILRVDTLSILRVDRKTRYTNKQWQFKTKINRESPNELKIVLFCSEEMITRRESNRESNPIG